MPMRVILGFTDDVTIEHETLCARIGVTRFRDAALASALRAGVPLTELEAMGTTMRGRTLAEVLGVLHSRCMLRWRFEDVTGATVATAVPRSLNVPWPPAPTPGAPEGARLSRFALLRPTGPQCWLLESGTSEWEVRLSPGAAAQLTASDPELLGLAGTFGLLDSTDDDPALATWEFHDRYFASHSRLDLGGGGTFRFGGTVRPLPANERPPGVGSALRLPPAPTTPPVDYWQLIEDRRTVRSFAPGPLPLTTLSALLWHTVRVRAVRSANPTDPHSYGAIFKPLASAGAMHAVNVWLISHNVAGLDGRAWWYNGIEHALHPVPGSTPLPPGSYGAPVTMLLTTRHARLAWKYEAIAYSLALKDVGVVMHALQLTGTALGLGVVPLGSGPVAAVASALAINPLEHSPVGELVLGLPSES